MIAGNDPDKNCLYHQLVGDAITHRYRFHAIIPPANPGEPPGINASNLEWWQYIGLKERHNLAMVIKPYIEDRKAHWQSVYASRRPTDASNGTGSASLKSEQPGALEAQGPKGSRKNLPSLTVRAPSTWLLRAILQSSPPISLTITPGASRLSVTRSIGMRVLTTQ